MYDIDDKFEMFMSRELWERQIDKAREKGISKSLLSRCCSINFRKNFAMLMLEDRYRIAPPHIGKIRKDNGKFREVYINEPFDRIWLSIALDVYMNLYKGRIHPNCISYQEGIGVPMKIKELSSKISKMDQGKTAGVKIDFHHFFDTINKETLYQLLDSLSTGSVIDTVIQEYYKDDHILTKDSYSEHYKSIAQGCALGGFLANLVLYDVDQYISENFDVIYYRYSDDVIIIGDDWEKALQHIQKEIPKYGVSINPKKIEYIQPDKWFTFLGFSIKGSQISISKNKLDKFKHEIRMRTIHNNLVKRGACTEAELKAAVSGVMRFLYKPLKGTNHGWDEYVFSAVNCEEDIRKLDEFIKDSLKAMLTNRKEIGGLGYQLTLNDGVVDRGRGRHVTENSKRVSSLKDYGYLSMVHMYKMYKNNKEVYRSYKNGINS